MKKLLIALVIISNTILFFKVTEVFEIQELSKMETIASYNQKFNKTVEFNSDINNYNAEELYQKLKNISIDYNIILINSSYINFDSITYSGSIKHYVYSNENIDDLFDLITDISLNFNIQEDLYYNNQIEEGIDFFLLNKKLDLSILPLSHMSHGEGLMFLHVFADDEETVHRAIDTIQQEFGNDYINNIREFEKDTLNISEMLSQPSSWIMFFSFSITVLVLILYIYLSIKKIAVLKLQGISNFSIGKELYLPTFIIMSITMYLVLAILFFIVIGTLNRKTIPIIQALFIFSIYQLIGLIVCGFITNALLLFVPKSQLIKNNNFNRYLMSFNYVVKIISVFVIILLINPHISTIQTEVSRMRQIGAQEDTIKNYQHSMYMNARYRWDGYWDILNQASLSLEDNDISDVIYENELLTKYHEAYDVLNDNGAIFCREAHFMIIGNENNNNLPEPKYPGLMVNTNYLNSFPIYDKERNIITESDINNSNSQVSYLIPETIYNTYAIDQIIGDMYNNSYQVIPIADNQNFVDFTASLMQFDIPEKSIIMVYSDCAFKLDKSPIDGMFVNDDMNEILKDTYFYNKLEIQNVGDEIQLILKSKIATILHHMTFVVPSLVLLIIIIIQYSYLYTKVYSKRIYTKYLLGISVSKIFFDLFLESSIVYLLPLAIAYRMENTIYLVTGLIVLDILVCIISIILFNKRNIAAQLKGEFE